MEPLRVEDDLLRRAAAGDVDAATAVLTRLVTGAPAEKLDTTRAVAEIRAATFWSLMLEYLADGTWNGVPVKGPDRKAARTRIVALFASAGAMATNEASAAREESLRRAIVGSSDEVSVVAIGISAQFHGTAPALIEVATGGSRQRRPEAIRALGLLRASEAVPLLMDLLNDHDEVVAGLAKNALVEIGGPAVEPLVTKWGDPATSGQVKWMAARALARIRDPRSIPTLVRHLNDPEYELRWLAADGLIVQERAGIKATLEAVAVQYLTSGLADAAAHVLKCAADPAIKEVVGPVIKSLCSIDFAWAASVPAEDALNELTTKGLI